MANVDDILLKKLGLYILALLEAFFTMAVFLIGHFVDGIPAEFATCIGSMIGATQLFIFWLIKRIFGIPVEEDIPKDEKPTDS